MGLVRGAVGLDRPSRHTLGGDADAPPIQIEDARQRLKDISPRSSIVITPSTVVSRTARRFSAVSLVERQIEILRQKNRKLERKLHELIDVARSNDSLAQKIHRLAQQLIKTGGSGTVCKLLEAALREDFGANQSVMVLFADKLDDTDSISKQRFVRLIGSGFPMERPISA